MILNAAVMEMLRESLTRGRPTKLRIQGRKHLINLEPLISIVAESLLNCFKLGRVLDLHGMP